MELSQILTFRKPTHKTLIVLCENYQILEIQILYFFVRVTEASLFKIKVISDVGNKKKRITELHLPSNQFSKPPAPNPSVFLIQ